MPRQQLNVTRVTPQGVAPATHQTGHVDGTAFENSGRVWVEVTNGITAARTVTFETPVTTGEFAVADLTVSIPISSTRRIGPFDPAIFNRGAEASVDPGKVWVNFNGGVNPELMSIAAYTV